MEAVREYGAELVPVDSEHNGAHQCLRAGNRQSVSRLILTASGGPFRNTPRRGAGVGDAGTGAAIIQPGGWGTASPSIPPP